MDWYSWLSKSGLEPSLVYEYSLLFAHNELEQEDIAYFNHEFLLSMGISIAKHRLEILKLAKKLQKRPVSRLFAAVAKTKKCLERYFNTLVVGRDRSAIVVVPKPAVNGGGGGGRWKGAMLKRPRRVVRLTITDGSNSLKINNKKVSSNPNSTGASPGPAVSGRGDGFWGGGNEDEMRWDSMFQDLKPT